MKESGQSKVKSRKKNSEAGSGVCREQWSRGMERHEDVVRLRADGKLNTSCGHGAQHAAPLQLVVALVIDQSFEPVRWGEGYGPEVRGGAVEGEGYFERAVGIGVR
jgi:hypothetical protein